MMLEQAVRISEIILAFALIQQSLEFIRGLPFEKTSGLIVLVLAVLLLFGIYPPVIEAILLVATCIRLYRLQGPYNGGSDAMSMLVLLCLFLSHLAPKVFWQEIALGYLAFQVTFSYFQSGYIKIINADWRNGKALRDVFLITAYPVSENTRRWAKYPNLILVMGWMVILFELLFPFLLLNKITLVIALCIAVLFHFANAWLFGLNRFFWVWPAAYPVIFWFQSRVVLPIIS